MMNCLLDTPAALALIAGDVPMAVSGIYRIRPAFECWELRQYFRLRREVFVREQQLFDGDDCDEHDDSACPIVAVSYAAGMGDEVVGAVRIYQPSPGVWYGSRLAVARDWRGVPGMAAKLISAAVGAARVLGCHTFLATVQRQNVPLFRRLHWSRLGPVVVRDQPHELMQASFHHYPPTRVGLPSADTRMAS